MAAFRAAKGAGRSPALKKAADDFWGYMLMRKQATGSEKTLLVCGLQASVARINAGALPHAPDTP